MAQGGDGAGWVVHSRRAARHCSMRLNAPVPHSLHPAPPASCTPPTVPSPPCTQAGHPDSVLAANMRACNEYRAGGPAAALHSLGSLPRELLAAAAAESGGSGGLHQRQLSGAALITHNAVVFGEGRGGLQVRPGSSREGPHAGSGSKRRRGARRCTPCLLCCSVCNPRPASRCVLPTLLPCQHFPCIPGAAPAGWRRPRGAPQPGAAVLQAGRPGACAGPAARHAAQHRV